MPGRHLRGDTYHPVLHPASAFAASQDVQGLGGFEGQPKSGFSNAGHATGPSLRGSLGPGCKTRQVKTQAYFKGQSVCFAPQRSPPTPPHACQQDTNPPQTNGPAHSCPGQDWLSWASEESVSLLSTASPTTAPSPGACSAPSTSMGPQAQEAPRASPPRPAPPLASKGFAIPPLPAGPWGEDVPAPSPPPITTSCPFQKFPPLYATASTASWQVPQRRHLQDPVTALP